GWSPNWPNRRSSPRYARGEERQNETRPDPQRTGVPHRAIAAVRNARNDEMARSGPAASRPVRTRRGGPTTSWSGPPRRTGSELHVGFGADVALALEVEDDLLGRLFGGE